MTSGANTAPSKSKARLIRDQLFGPANWAWSLKHLNPSEKLLALALVDHDHIDGVTKQRKAEVWPTQATLATMTGLTDRTIRRSLKALEDKNVIARAGRYARFGRAVHYRILYPSGPDMVSASNAAGPDICDIRSGHGVRSDPDMVSDKLISKRENGTREPARHAPHVEQENTPLVAFAPRSVAPENVGPCGESVPQDEPCPSPSPGESTKTNMIDRSGHGVRTDADSIEPPSDETIEATLDMLFGPEVVA